MNEDVQAFYDNGHDPTWRLHNIYEIVNKEACRVPFQPNIVQQKINESQANRKIILKARQFGVSTNELIKLLDWAMYNENSTAAIIAHKSDAIETLFQIPRLTYENLPKKMKPELDRGNGSKYEMYFPEINSRIYCDLEVRGGTIGRLHVSEAAFMADSAKLKATLQAVPITTGKVTIETTPNGMANYFYDLWNEQNDIYEKFFFPWYIFPQYQMPVYAPIDYTDDELKLIDKAKKLYNIDITQEQIQFRRFKKSEMKFSVFDVKRVLFEQEYPEDDKSCFLASGNAVIDAFKIDEMLTNALDPIRIDKGIRIFKEPDKYKTYVCAGDPAEGIGKDSSASVVLDIETLEIVASFKGFLKPSDFAYKLVEICDIYKSPNKFPMLAVERNNHGHAVLLQLDHLRYPNVYCDKKDELPGWKSTPISRPLMVDRFIQAVESDDIKIYDKEILSECLTLIDNNGKIEAATGKHDDLIIACAIALQVKPDSSASYADFSSKIHL